MTTILLAQLMGPILIAVGLGFLFNRGFYSKMAKDFEQHDGLMYLAGIFTMLLGLLMVLNHNIWELNTVGLITLLGWATLVKGAVILIMPKLFRKQIHACLTKKCLISMAGVITIALGGYLAWFGFFG